MKQEVQYYMNIETLTASNYSQWIKELKNFVKQNEVWQYIDLQNDRVKKLNLKDYADVEDINKDDIFQDVNEITNDEYDSYHS